MKRIVVLIIFDELLTYRILENTGLTNTFNENMMRIWHGDTHCHIRVHTMEIRISTNHLRIDDLTLHAAGFAMIASVI